MQVFNVWVVVRFLVFLLHLATYIVLLDYRLYTLTPIFLLYYFLTHYRGVPRTNNTLGSFVTCAQACRTLISKWDFVVCFESEVGA